MLALRLVLCLAFLGACAGFSPTAARPARVCGSSAVLDSARVARHTSSVLMAVPKKRQSKQRSATRKAVWLGKPRKAAILAISRAAAAGFDPLADESEPKEAAAAPAKPEPEA